MDGSDRGNGPDYAAWDRGNIRGLKRRRFVGIEKDADGNETNVYEADDDEWGNTVPVYEDDAERLYHLTHHRSIYDPNCRFCHQYRER